MAVRAVRIEVIATNQGSTTRREAWNRPFPSGSSSEGPILQRKHGPEDSLIVFGLQNCENKILLLEATQYYGTLRWQPLETHVGYVLTNTVHMSNGI